MTQPESKHPRPGRTYQGAQLSVQNLPTGVRFDERERAELLERLAAAGRITNAKEAFPPPKPDPQPVTILYPFLLAVFPFWIYGLQGRGDCMGWSAILNVDTLMGVNIALLEKLERAVALASIEAQYGFMRVEVYGGQPDYGGDGASPSGAAESVLKIGTLHCLQYLEGRYDLREYDQSGGRSGRWGRYGVPDELEPIARQHFIQDVALVTDFDTAVQLLAQGIPISNAHPSNPIWTHRDVHGFGDRRWNASHAMNYIGYRLGARPGLLKANWGHGNHVSGPMHPEDCPPAIAGCAAWEDAEVANDVLRAEWSWAYSDYIGFPQRDLSRASIPQSSFHPNHLAA